MNQSAPRRIAIACQGGGSHTAFTAGVLKALLQQQGEVYRICALSGTSGGAICAVLAWYGLLREAQGGWSRAQTLALLDDFWQDNGATLPWEKLWNDWTINTIQLMQQGRLPELKSSPYSQQFMLSSELLTKLAPRKEFFDLRLLLAKYLKLEAIKQPTLEPRLLIGAVGVLSGTFKAFDSLHSEISID
ncbi:patatin-like phospholipase family protein, partial [Candidatus Gracilibacteria bacterium]|nr:patatin-like phospholipase family protein [Candidatus Gracilibacteria bacterium]